MMRGGQAQVTSSLKVLRDLEHSGQIELPVSSLQCTKCRRVVWVMRWYCQKEAVKVLRNSKFRNL